jgi:hypothetical protein
MIPETFGSLLAFLALVAPGLVYRAVLHRRRASPNDSAVVEASRIALTSLVFSLAGLTVLWLLRKFTAAALPDVAAWIHQGNFYVATNLGKVFVGLTIEVGVACSIAALTAWLTTRGSTSRFRDDTIYATVFRRLVPKGFKPWVYVRLDNDIEYWGYERAHEGGDDSGSRLIVLDGQGLRRRQPGEAQWQPIGDFWDVGVLGSDRIRLMQVIYRNQAGDLAGAVSPTHPHGKRRGQSSQPVVAATPSDAVVAPPPQAANPPPPGGGVVAVVDPRC